MLLMPLDGVKVLDLTHYIAGPYCTKILADYGAEVIKIERLDGGDPARRLGPFPDDMPDLEKSGLFLALNINKLDITLNLKSDGGLEIFRKLVQDADILVENFEPRVMPNLGLSYETLRQINPRLIMTSISNFGQTGPYRDYKAVDMVMAAMGGTMYISGDYDKEPLRHGVPISQFMAGQNGALATLAALYLQEETGAGQHIDVSIMEAVSSSMPWTLTWYSYMGAIPRRGPKSRRVFGADLWPSKDGYIGMSVMRGRSIEEVATMLEIPELANEKFATSEGRLRHNEELERLVLDKFMEWSKLEFFRTGHEWRFMTSVSLTPQEVLENEQLEARGFFIEMDHPRAGVLKYPGEIMGLSENPMALRRPAPLLGEHNEEIYCNRLGYSSAELTKLKQLDVI